MRVSIGLAALLVAGCSGGDDTPTPDARPPAIDANMNLLSQAGLYSDFANREIAPDLVEFAPTYLLWSDALVKRRWLRLPPGEKIQTADMDHWTFPVGTQVWKEFATSNGMILETRLIERVGPSDYRFGAYIWNDAQTEAVYSTAGEMNVLGTDHDVPTASDCLNCHRGEPGRILGFSAIQLDPAVFSQVSFTIPPRPAGFRPTAWDPAIGYLHANCGNCHNPDGSAGSATNMLLRLDVAEVDASAPDGSGLFQSIVDVNTQVFRQGQDCTTGTKWKRIARKDLGCSAIYVRMMARGTDGVQMPPIASKHPDTDAVDALAAWINSL